MSKPNTAGEDHKEPNTRGKDHPSAQNITLNPRFLFGLKGDVRNNIFFLEENVVLYPCGHNVVIFNIEDKSQKYISGIEGSEGITALAVSQKKQFIAVCEKAEKAVCVVYQYEEKSQTIKRRKILTSTEY